MEKGKGEHSVEGGTDPARSTWVAQLVGHQTLDFSLDHDLEVVRLSPELGSTLRGESASSFSFSLCPFPSSHVHECSLSLSLSNN